MTKTNSTILPSKEGASARRKMQKILHSTKKKKNLKYLARQQRARMDSLALGEEIRVLLSRRLRTIHSQTLPHLCGYTESLAVGKEIQMCLHCRLRTTHFQNIQDTGPFSEKVGIF